jgi:hypothetical protein
MLGLREGGIRPKLVAIMVSNHIMTLRSLMNSLLEHLYLPTFSGSMTAFQGMFAEAVVAPASSWDFALARRLHAEQPLYP